MKSAKKRRIRSDHKVRYIRLGITAELDELLREYMKKFDSHEACSVLFEAVSALLEARQENDHWWHVCATRLAVVPGESHWREHCDMSAQIDRVLRKATEVACG